MFLPELKSKVGEDICILIKLDNHSANYICECGDASLLGVKDCQNTDAIFISHTHIDHFSNFDTILRHQLGIKRSVIICGPEGIAEQVQSKIRSYTWNLVEENAVRYEIREILDYNHIKVSALFPPKWELKDLGKLENEPIFKNDRFKVNYTILDHKIPSIAFLFQEKNTVSIDLSSSNFKGGKWINELKQAFVSQHGEKKIMIDGIAHSAKDLFPLLKIKKGDTLGIIMDHAANAANHDKIKALFNGSNKVFIECFYAERDKEFAALNFHSYSIESAKIMKQCNVTKPIPVHFSRKYKEQEINDLMAEFYQELEK